MTKTILITGASSGIGAGMAREFAQMGYNLAICARRLERLETLKQELEQQYGIRVIAKSLDVTNYDQVFQYFVNLNKTLDSWIELLSMQVWAKDVVLVKATLPSTKLR